MVGKMISHYMILVKLGGGGMGVVYKAEDTRLKRTVALKFLPPTLTSDLEAKERFIHEAQAASALQHNNICVVYDIDETSDGQMFISMEYLEGETLKKKIERGPLKVEEAIDIAVQVAHGLAKAHEHCIVHRDIKPANVMITSDGVGKIVDFGLAKLSGRTMLTKTGSTLGTAAYMSPEQASGEPADHRTDIWSLGVLLHEMLTGKRPFEAEYENALLYSILNSEPEPISALRTGIPMELERIVHKCLAKVPRNRYQHIDEMQVDLRKAQLESPSAAKSKKQMRSLPLLIGAGLALVALLVLAYIFVLPRAAPPPDKSVAVLPFQNFSAEGPYAYFAGGLHDELLTQLSKVGALKVISRTSVMGYEATKTPLKQIARELGVGSIVEGSVQVMGDRLRVNVQLIDAETDAHLWAEHYDRTLDDAFAIQSDVAQQIVAAVGGALTSSEKGRLTAVPTANAEAYRLYMQGREYFIRPGYLRQNFEIAQGLYEQALTLDPGFALAHAALSEVHGFMYWFRHDPSPARAVRQREEAEAALQLAPELPQAHNAIGLAHYWERRDYRRALYEFGVASKNLPNSAGLWAWIGYIHRRLGNWEKVFEAFGKATDLNPRDANLFYDLGGASYIFVRRYADAVSALDRALTLAPDLHNAAIRKGLTYISWRGQFDTLRAVLSRIPSDAQLRGTRELSERRAALLLWERKADSVLQLLQNARVTVFESQSRFLPTALYAAWAHQMRGDRPAARAAFESSRVFLDSVVKEIPDDWRVHAALGHTLAGLGRREEALREAQWLQRSEIYRGDRFDGPLLAASRAQILAEAGDTDGALDELERLLTGPSDLSVHTLRLVPSWDPIRNHPRFRTLLTKYAEH
jgi:serine/threonine protein kinase/tetratricopeptide (TPR) repeat protein